MPLGRVEGQPGAPADTDGDLPQAVDPAGERAVRVELRQAVDRRFERAAGVEQRQVRLAAYLAQPARILGVELAAHRLDLFGGERKFLGRERVDEVGQGEVDRDAACSRG